MSKSEKNGVSILSCESPEPKTKQYLAISTKQLTTLDSVSHVTKTTHEKFYIFAGAEEQCVTLTVINFNITTALHLTKCSISPSWFEYSWTKQRF